MALFEDVIRMYQSGMTDADIVQRLTIQGYSPRQISDSINQARVKQSASPGPEQMTPSILEEQQVPAPMPAPSPYQVPSPQMPMPTQMPSRQPSQPESYYPYQYPTYEQQPQKMETEDIEEIAEEIVDEKWQEVKSKISDVIDWKTYAEKRIIAVEDRLKRIESSFDRIQVSLLGKVQEYGQNIRDISAEMGSMQNAFGKVLSPLVDNVKELGRLTEDLKKAKK
jgi:hypothetical protein